MLTHAGCVVVRRTADALLFLVISSSDGTRWVLPKGHIDPGESPEEAAVRELREEAGITGEIIARLSIAQFRKQGENVRAQFFLVEETGCCEPKESRIVRWENESSALELLSFETARKILREGADSIKASGPHDTA